MKLQIKHTLLLTFLITLGYTTSVLAQDVEQEVKELSKKELKKQEKEAKKLAKEKGEEYVASATNAPVQEDPNIHKITLLKDANGKRQSSFGTSFYGTNSVVYASSKKYKGKKNKIWSGNGQPYLDLLIGDIAENHEIINSRQFGGKEINTELHESNAVFTNDSTTVYFSRNNYLNNDFVKDSTGTNLIQLYKATRNGDGSWGNVQPLPFNNSNYQTGHPALSKDNTKLYFISDMPGTYGDTDIFVVSINADGTYGTPQNLGPNVNTYGKEMFPYVDDNNFLYFSSNAFSSAGGNLDIFVTPLSANGEPLMLGANVGGPINSENDDFALVSKDGTDWGYFSSDRKDKSTDDIYSFKFSEGFYDKVRSGQLGASTSTLANFGSGAGSSALGAINSGCANVYEGVVTEEGTQANLPGALVSVYDKDGKLFNSVRSNDFGHFTIALPCNQGPYKFLTSKANYRDDIDMLDNFTTPAGKAIALSDVMNISLQPLGFVAGGGNMNYVGTNNNGAGNNGAGNYGAGNNGAGNNGAAGNNGFGNNNGAGNNGAGNNGAGNNGAGNNGAGNINNNNSGANNFYNNNAVGLKGIIGAYLMINGLNPIYFDLNKSDIRVDAAIELEKVIKILNEYPEVRINCASFTDSRNTESYNLALSERRAKATRDWLIMRGISADRLTAEGFGKNNPVNRCKDGVNCTEVEYQLNRRTEFIVANPEAIRGAK